MTKIEAIAAWRETGAGALDYPARRESWAAFLDGLARDGRVTEAQAFRWTLPTDCQPRGRCVHCGARAPRGRRYCDRCRPAPTARTCVASCPASRPGLVARRLGRATPGPQP